MFKQPRSGTNCERCQNHVGFDGRSRSEHPASTVCQWCLVKLCSIHAESIFGDESSVRACFACGDNVRRHTDALGNLHIRSWIWDAWVATYSSATFTGYPPGAR